jgi:hypothetical protein
MIAPSSVRVWLHVRHHKPIGIRCTPHELGVLADGSSSANPPVGTKAKLCGPCRCHRQRLAEPLLGGVCKVCYCLERCHGRGKWKVRQRGFFPGQIACQVLLAAIATNPIFVPVAAHADWRSWLFGPKDYEECAENAAREAKSKDALAILLSSCESKFTARHKPTGGYTFYDTRQNRYFDVAGPNPTPAELEYIEREYSAYIVAKAEFDRRQREYEREEAERQSAMQREEAERQSAMRRAEAERQRVAKAEFQQRQQTALSKIEVMSSSIECAYAPTTCGIYKCCDRQRRCVLQGQRFRRLARTRTATDVNRGAHGARADLQTRQSLFADAIRAGSTCRSAAPTVLGEAGS